MNVPGNARFGTFCEPSSENSDSALCRFDRANRSAPRPQIFPFETSAPNAFFAF